MVDKLKRQGVRKGEGGGGRRGLDGGDIGNTREGLMLMCEG